MMKWLVGLMMISIASFSSAQKASMTQPLSLGELMLATDPSVQKELKMKKYQVVQIQKAVTTWHEQLQPTGSPANRQKVEEAQVWFRAELLKILGAGQESRIRAIGWRRSGLRSSFRGAAVDLGLTARQLTNLAANQAAWSKALQDMLASVAPPNTPDNSAVHVRALKSKIDANRKKLDDQFESKALKLLTLEQLTKWRAMTAPAK